ncbi:hypothetical protein Ndes2437B_g00904 [Nannochloris sp. 'desiccata']
MGQGHPGQAHQEEGTTDNGAPSATGLPLPRRYSHPTGPYAGHIDVHPSLLPASAGGRVLTGDDEWSNQVSLSEGRCPLQHTLLRKGLLANPTLTSLGPTYFIWYASIEVLKEIEDLACNQPSQKV